MAIAVIGGVISSTLLSLVVVPVFYLSVENFKRWLGRVWQWLQGLFGGGRSASAARPSAEPSSAE
jgi:hypothetical protein